MKMVVGLGNPGKTYEHTRHNAGFDVLEEMARRERISFRRSWRAPVQTVEMSQGAQRIGLVKPLTFMNRSGSAVAALMRKKGVEPKDLIVVVDDVDLKPGALRIRKKGSAGGHNGLQSIIENIGTDEFVRVRVGVGRPSSADEMVGHVLSRFHGSEHEVMSAAIDRAADAVLCLIQDGADEAMNKFNG